MSKDTVVFDMETDGLLEEGKRIHCLVLQWDGKYEKYYDGRAIAGYTQHGTVNDGIHRLTHFAATGRTLVGHNIVGFDFPFLSKLGRTSPAFDVHRTNSIFDTYIGSCLMFPEKSPGLA